MGKGIDLVAQLFMDFAAHGGIGGVVVVNHAGGDFQHLALGTVAELPGEDVDLARGVEDQRRYGVAENELLA